jgi:hypothetical protein
MWFWISADLGCSVAEAVYRSAQAVARDRFIKRQDNRLVDPPARFRIVPGNGDFAAESEEKSQIRLAAATKPMRFSSNREPTRHGRVTTAERRNRALKKLSGPPNC